SRAFIPGSGDGTTKGNRGPPCPRSRPASYFAAVADRKPVALHCGWRSRSVAGALVGASLDGLATASRIQCHPGRATDRLYAVVVVGNSFGLQSNASVS